ncbi:MAG TPA: acetyl-CoA carboxylase carboxyltransferase subunit [Gammaproteobacteria bacterium]|jgi:geranyl-CoA carboxylase beta subunit|nr:acetyl-CoA carboxylase carboxyltransferase subunit [Gammaproteobacteria bacterium]
MAIIQTQIDTNSAEYQQNSEAMSVAVDEARTIERRVIELARSKEERYKQRGLLVPRERLTHLLDRGAPFLEMSTLCGYLQEGDKDGSAAGGSCLTGLGYVQGTLCAILVDDYLTKGGSITQLGSGKRRRMYELAMAHKLPVIALAQSGGGNLTTLGDWFGFSGQGFAQQCRLSAKGIPQITVVHGSATAGGAYQPGLSDYVIMIRKQSTVYLAGPPLLKAATGEIATDEEIGGAEMHASTAGTADYLAENDEDGIRIAREVTAKLGWDKNADVRATPEYQEPLYATQELIGMVPVDPKTPFDMREVIARIADASDFVEFKAEYDAGTVCGHISIQGIECGVIANNAPITANGAAKAGQFVQLCEQSETPLLFLHNTTGFMVGTAAEQAGIIKHGAKMIQAVTNATVAKISVIVGGSYGAGNYAMCGKSIDPDFIFAWPKSIVSVMGAEQAGSVIRTVAQAKMKRMGAVDEAMLDSVEQDTVDAMEARSGALANTARLWDDALIDPRDTRSIVGFALRVCREGRGRTPKLNTFGIARL